MTDEESRAPARPTAKDTDIPLHFGEGDKIPRGIKKYFRQRYDLFSKYDEGIQLTHDAWFGVTPEHIAK